MRGKIVYAGILAVTVYLNMLYHWELGNFVLAFEGMFLLFCFVMQESRGVVCRQSGSIRNCL